MVAALALASASARFDVLGEGAVAEQLLAASERVAARLGGGPLQPGRNRSGR
jgi:hypothetical protein